MADFITDYFISPIFERTGYNIVNTLVYAAIALVSLYLIWKFLKKREFDFSSRDFLYGVGSFVLFGSTARVLVDLSDSGMMAKMALGSPLYASVAASHVFDYGFLTVTPGIYVVTGLLFLISIAAGMAMKNSRFPYYAGILLWLPCFLLLIPFMQNFGYFLLGAGIAAAGALAAYWVLKKYAKLELGIHEKLAILGQALDGAATYTVIDVFSKATGKGYFEQHVLSGGIGTATPLGFFLFFLVKVALAGAIVYFLSKEKINASDKALVLVVVGIMGFAPGIRDLLRMLTGT